MVVAIDGPAGAGKSTIARTVADRAGLLYINSGNFYRAITLAVLEAGADPSDPPSVLAVARSASVELMEGRIRLGGRDVERALHTDRVDRWVARHSAIPEIRSIVNAALRRAVAGIDVIVEGRDIGTEVFPDAEVKIFLDASIAVRARRRFEQGVSALSLAEIEDNIRERDKIDRDKPVGGLRAAQDALRVDSSDLTIDEVCERVIGTIQNPRPPSSRSRFA